MGSDEDRDWDFDEAEVAVGLTCGYLRITQPREIADYVRTLTDLASMAVHGVGARQLITAAVATLG
ncbi:hypothetical protein [Kitasatospora azatica]|uniref:hypothetical protein n=1 Tax=Kitasatospora azatica TaxID=58347 RepID=UPI000559F25F|nr:hypothetical protein [Kitasatospora azatica]